jgi:hypothetical protein
METVETLNIDETWTYGCNRCVVCNEFYKHTRIWWGESYDDAKKGIYLLKDKVGHASCIKIVNDIKKKRNELLDLEYKLFEKQYMISPK